MAVLGLTVDLNQPKVRAELNAIQSRQGQNAHPATVAYIQGKLNYLATSRPTAVNLFNALEEIRQLLAKSRPTDDLVSAIGKHAQFMLHRDLADNRAIGQHGADAILPDHTHQATILTICNTGSLATSGYGTALGVVRAIRDRNQLHRVVALETRPYNQGSRLTAFEMTEEQMPGATLICDGMAGAFLQQHAVDAVVVGADRVCANGDTANKIGTYGLTLLAKAHNVPVYVAAPLTTIDLSLPDGSHIPIEERPPKELLQTSNAPATVGVWNPAFDVTPGSLLAGIVTEKGVIRRGVDGTMDVAGFVKSVSEGSTPATKGSGLVIPSDYTEYSVDTLAAYLAKESPETMEHLGTTQADDLECVEMGDGNLNLVFIVTNKKDTSKQVIVKQSLPYVRCVGESWPLTLERSYFEWKALSIEKAACPSFVPDIYFFSKSNGLIAMQYLAPPTIILRKGLIQGIKYPTMASDMGTFCARTLFRTSGFALSTSALRKQVEFWSKNRDMCELTEQVVFTEPYISAPNNRWTSPQLDDEKKAIENDSDLKAAAAGYKRKFVSETQALLHADLHSGSVMCKPEAGQTFVIDPEFAFYGPMGFDTGAFVANLFLAYVSQAGHSNDADYDEWILTQIQIFYDTFEAGFLEQWNNAGDHTGFVFGREVFPDAAKDQQKTFMASLLADTLGFAGMKMLRRIVGIAHVEDLESIADADVRARCEKRGLAIAKHLIMNAASVSSMTEAIEFARNTKETG